MAGQAGVLRIVTVSLATAACVTHVFVHVYTRSVVFFSLDLVSNILKSLSQSSRS